MTGHALELVNPLDISWFPHHLYPRLLRLFRPATIHSIIKSHVAESLAICSVVDPDP
jgi:hypothetical protein